MVVFSHRLDSASEAFSSLIDSAIISISETIVWSTCNTFLPYSSVMCFFMDSMETL